MDWSRAVRAADTVRSGAGRQNSRSRAACTRVPLVAGAEGGSGSRSMLEKRNASAQSVKVETFDGERLVGSSRAMASGYARGVTGTGTPDHHRTLCHIERMAPRAGTRLRWGRGREWLGRRPGAREGGEDAGGDGGRVLEGPEVAELGVLDEGAVGQAL